MKPFASSFTLSGLSKNLRFLKRILLLFQYCKDIPESQEDKHERVKMHFMCSEKENDKGLITRTDTRSNLTALIKKQELEENLLSASFST